LRLRHTRLVSAALCLCLNSCQLYHTLPATETDGSYSRLPNSSSRVVVWGTHPEAVKSLTTWLLKHGYIVIDELKIRQLGRDTNLPMPLSNVDTLKLARTAGAKEVIFVDADVSTWKFPDALEWFGQSPNAYKASLFIRAVNAETGEINWDGKALSVDKFPDLAKGIHRLTCNALATGWGLQKPGIAADTHICPEGQNVMVFNEIPSTSREEVVRSSNTPELEAHP
jgi:hypothetical protein